MTPTNDPFNSNSNTLQEDIDSDHIDFSSSFNDFADNGPAILTTQESVSLYMYKLHTENTENDYSLNNNEDVERRNIEGNIQVVEPRKETEQQSTFISYLVIYNKKVRRRFQDFVWLHNVLYTNYPACFVPPLPDKHRLEYVKGDRFSQKFIERRRTRLERFVQRIARHPILGKADFFIMFLESAEFNNASERALRESQESMIDTIGDSLLNAFAKIRKQDPRFVEMKEKSERMEENLDLLQKTLSKTHKRTEELCKDYEEMRSSVQEVSELDKSHPLINFASILSKYNDSMKRMAVSESEWQMEVYDYMSYYRSIKSVLKLRDQKQLDFEELSEYYQSTVEEKEKIVQNKKDSSMANFISDRINEVRGADAEKIKRERILRLDERMRELQDAVDETHKVSSAFSNQVKKEDMFFNRNKSVELFHVLKSYTDSKVNHFSESTTMWKELVQDLENLP